MVFSRSNQVPIYIFFLGNALGDALGLATEFLSKKEVTKIYKDNPIPFASFHLNMHNMRWVKEIIIQEFLFKLHNI